MRRALLVLACALAPARPAAAQVNTSTVPNQTVKSPGWLIQLLRPDVADDGAIIDCTFGQTPDCAPFNRAVCSDPALDREIVISVTATSTLPPNTTATSGVTASVWLQNNATVCNLPAAADANTTHLLGTSNGFLPSLSTFLGGSTAFVFPTGGTSVTRFSMRDVMTAFDNVCAPDGGIPLTPFKLCIGADLNQDGIVGVPLQGSLANDPVAFFQFPVGTLAPPMPTLGEVESLVRRVRVNVTYDSTTNETAFLDVFWAPATAEVLAAPDCTQWPGGQSQQLDVRYTGTGTAALDVPGTNGEIYAYCVRARDFLNNSGPTTAVVTASPHTECDFFECYPEDLQVGYCGQGVGASALGLALCGLLRHRGRRRLVRRAP